METTSRKAVAHSMPRNRANMSPKATVRKSRTIQNTTHTTTNKTVRKSGIQPLALMQDKISKALGLIFDNANDVHVSYVSNGTLMTITCQANGYTATVTMSEDMKGGQQS